MFSMFAGSGWGIAVPAQLVDVDDAHAQRPGDLRHGGRPGLPPPAAEPSPAPPVLRLAGGADSEAARPLRTQPDGGVPKEVPMTSVMSSAPSTRAPSRRSGTAPVGAPLRPLLAPLLLAAVLVAAAAVLAPAGTSVVAPGGLGGQPAGAPGATRAAPAGAAPLTAAERARVRAYADGLRPDDPLVEVRPGVWAKHSNVAGVHLDGRTVYYDLLGHQSFGPWRRGQVGEADVVVVAREGAEPARLVMYALK